MVQTSEVRDGYDAANGLNCTRRWWVRDGGGRSHCGGGSTRRHRQEGDPIEPFANTWVFVRSIVCRDVPAAMLQSQDRRGEEQLMADVLL